MLLEFKSERKDHGFFPNVLNSCHLSSERPADLVSPPEFSPCLSGLLLPPSESRRATAGGLWGCLAVSSMPAGLPRDLTPVDTCVGSVYAERSQRLISSLSLPSFGPQDPFKARGQGGPAGHGKAHSVLPLSLQQGWGGEGKGLTEASAHMQSGRKTQDGLLRGDGTCPRPLACPCLPGANQPPLRSRAPSHALPDQEEMAGRRGGQATRPPPWTSLSVLGARGDTGPAGRM